jgi:Peptidase family M23
MVLTLPTYNPPMVVSDIAPGGFDHPAGKGLLSFNVRILTSRNEVVIDFGEFSDLISWRDTLSVEGASGSFTFRMRVSLCNEDLLKKIHPGLVVEAYCARNDDSLRGVIRDPSVLRSSVNDPIPEQAAAPEDLDPDNVQVFNPTTEPVVPTNPDPVEDAYLDQAPYLLLRGIITDYGRSSEGGASFLYVTGESYGKIYKDAFAITDLHAPEQGVTTGKSLEVRKEAQVPQGAAIIYYRLLRDWVEHFWGEETGWEARTRPIPYPPNYMARINNEGSVWSNLQFLSVEGFFHMFVDHTGAIVWEKLPYSGKDRALIPGREWEDLPMIAIPSWKILSWNDRLSEQGVTNYLRCCATQQGHSGGQEQGAAPAFIYNMGSIRQYGGPNKREFYFPVGIQDIDNWYTSEPRRLQQAGTNSFLDLCAIEAISWYDRPIQRVGVTVRGEAAWRIHTRVNLKEDWHCPDAEAAEYYVVSRTHQLDIENGAWISNLELLRDRRKRYLGIGVGATQQVGNVTPPIAAGVKVSALDWRGSDGATVNNGFNFVFPDNPDIEVDNQAELYPDEYWFYDRFANATVNIGGDALAWANENIVKKMGQEGQVVNVPNAGLITEYPPGYEPFEPVQVTDFGQELFGENSVYQFSISRDGNPYIDVPAPATGRVTRAEYLATLGNTVEIQDGQLRWQLSQLDTLAVRTGQKITQGQSIGTQNTAIQLQVFQRSLPLEQPQADELVNQYVNLLSNGQ